MDKIDQFAYATESQNGLLSYLLPAPYTFCTSFLMGGVFTAISNVARRNNFN